MKQAVNRQYETDVAAPGGRPEPAGRSDEESWVRLPDGRVMTYTFVSLFQLQ